MSRDDFQQKIVFSHEDFNGCYTVCTKYLMSDYTEWEKPQTTEGSDWFGVRWRPVAATANLTHPDTNREPVLKDVANWESEMRFPDLDRFDRDAVRRQFAAQMLPEDDCLYCVMLEHGAFERLTLLMGFENALMAPDKWREIFRDANKRIVDHAHEKNLYFIYHSCGRMENLATDLADLGIDAL
jgi:hypothetical protein